QLVKQAGLEGAPVTVWGQTRAPRKQYVEYYTSVLNKIGFKATPKIISDSVYFPTIGNAKTGAQTLRRLAAGLPEPIGLLPPHEREEHPAGQQRELLERERPARPERAREAQRGARDQAGLGQGRVAVARPVHRQAGLSGGLRLRG